MARKASMSAALLLLLQVAVLIHAIREPTDAREEVLRARARRRLTWADWETELSGGNELLDKKERLGDEFQEGVKFQLYTRENREDPELINIYDSTTPHLKYFDSSRPTKVLCHGWQTDMVGMISLKDALLQAEDQNAIIVNWKSVDHIVYPIARSKVDPIGQRVAYLLEWLQNVYKVPIADVHLVGHSLGAHIMGRAGTVVRGGTVSRITALDPAGVLIGHSPSLRLDHNDADFVVVIHTCGNVLGYAAPIGHVDFYPNGGVCSQPGCLLSDLSIGGCSHSRGYYYLAESLIGDRAFEGFPCKGLNGRPDLSNKTAGVIMGMETPASESGIYCFATNEKSPYALTYDEMLETANHIHTSDTSREPNSDASFATSFDVSAGNSIEDMSSSERDRIIHAAFMKRGIRQYHSYRSD